MSCSPRALRVTRDPADDAKPENDLDDIERIRNGYFDPLRDVAFHWALFAKKRAFTNSSGVAAIAGTWLVVSLGADVWNGVTDTMVAGTFMHELGHNLGLYHGGTQNISAFTPHYMSVMSYHYQLGGVPVDGRYRLDYARISIAALDEALLSETAALSPGDSTTTEIDLARYTNPQICLVQTGIPGNESCHEYATLEGNLSENLDFNRVNGVEFGTVAANLDGFAGNSTMPALEDDWSHLVYHGGRVLGTVLPPRRRHVAAEEVVDCLSHP